MAYGGKADRQTISGSASGNFRQHSLHTANRDSDRGVTRPLQQLGQHDADNFIRVVAHRKAHNFLGCLARSRGSRLVVP